MQMLDRQISVNRRALHNDGRLLWGEGGASHRLGHTNHGSGWSRGGHHRGRHQGRAGVSCCKGALRSGVVNDRGFIGSRSAVHSRLTDGGGLAVGNIVGAEVSHFGPGSVEGSHLVVASIVFAPETESVSLIGPFQPGNTPHLLNAV